MADHAADSGIGRVAREPRFGFVLLPEAVDRLRAAAGTIIRSSPALQRLLKDTGAKLIMEPEPAGDAATAH